MKISYDKKADSLYIKVSNSKIHESEEKSDNVIIDFDKKNKIVGIEILYFVKKHKKDFFPIFKEVEKTVWENEPV
jgi:uncharacterized protein YuzE